MVLKWSLESKPVLDKTAGPSQFYNSLSRWRFQGNRGGNTTPLKTPRERLVMANHIIQRPFFCEQCRVVIQAKGEKYLKLETILEVL